MHRLLDRARGDECPECSARQWLYLAPLLKGFELVDARCGCKTESARAEAC